MIGLVLGLEVLITGIEDQPEGWTKVFIGPRYKNIYVVPMPEEVERVKRAWGSTAMHITMPKPDSDHMFNDEYPYDPSESLTSESGPGGL